MPIRNDYTGAFVDADIDKVQSISGVYQLYYGRVVSYIGMSAASVRDRLRSHKRGDNGPCTEVSTAFTVEYTLYPKTREQQLLQEYKDGFGGLPSCNDVMP